jgi:hypothetical protein
LLELGEVVGERGVAIMFSTVARFPVLAFLLGVDSCLLLLYTGNFFFEGFSSPLFLLGDWSLSEILNYGKEFVLFTLALFLVRATKQPLFIAWGLLFIYLLADDLLGLHELFGFLFWQLFPTLDVAGIGSRNVGEFLFFALAGSVLLVFVWQAHRYSNAQSRTFTWWLLPWLGLLVLCGMVIDAIHIFFMEDPMSDFIFTLLEDGGETVVLSFMVWRVVAFCKFTAGKKRSPMSLRAS